MERLAPTYINISDFLFRKAGMQTHRRINKNEVIGDILPINTLPNFSGFLINIFSTSQGKLKRKSVKIKLQ